MSKAALRVRASISTIMCGLAPSEAGKMADLRCVDNPLDTQRRTGAACFRTVSRGIWLDVLKISRAAHGTRLTLLLTEGPPWVTITGAGG